MPIEAQTVEYVYQGDGTTTVFPFPSKFSSNKDVIVGINGSLLTGGYTVIGAGSETGGSVTFVAAPVVGSLVALLRRPDASQLIDFVNGQTVLEGVLDSGLDKLTMLIQYVLRGLQKSIRLSEFDSSVIDALPLAPQRANYFLGFDSAGGLALKDQTVSFTGDTTTDIALPGGGSASVYDKMKREINVLDFGAVGDGAADDTAAINAAVAYIRGLPGPSRPTLRFGTDSGAGKNFLVTAPINLTGLQPAGFALDLNGSTITARTNGAACLDVLDTSDIRIANGTIVGGTNPPSFGIQCGRAVLDVATGLGREARDVKFENLRFSGDFTKGCVYANAPVDFWAGSCKLRNATSLAGAYALVLDSGTSRSVTSTFIAISAPANTNAPMTNNVWLHCAFNRSEVATTDRAAVLLTGVTRGLRLASCTARCGGANILLIGGSHYGPMFDIHNEIDTTAPVHWAQLLTASSNVTFYDALFSEPRLETSQQMFITNGGTGSAKMYGCRLEVHEYTLASSLFNPNGRPFDFSGVVSIGDGVFSGIYNLAPLTSFTGDVFVKNNVALVTLPAAGCGRIVSSTDSQMEVVGPYRVRMGAIISLGEIPVNNGVITIPKTGAFFLLSGTGTVTGIATDASNNGRSITLRVSGGPVTVVNSFLGNTLMAGNYVMSNNATLTLTCANNIWVELCRSNNVFV